MMSNCKHCGREFEYNRSSGHRKKTCNSCSVTIYRKRRKIRLIEYKGGGCEICGYNKCADALEFHHLDPSNKEFNISKKGKTKITDEDYKELDKCILLCANCHREIHSEDSKDFGTVVQSVATTV